MELVQVQELRHPRSADLVPHRQVGPSLNGSSVEESPSTPGQGESKVFRCSKSRLKIFLSSPYHFGSPTPPGIVTRMLG
jgi:hypothetical protein